MKHILFLPILFLFSISLSGQSQYAEIDDYVRSNKFPTKNIEALTHELTDQYETDEEKLRAIYIWITDNIAYDFKLYQDRNSNKSKKSKSKNKITYKSEAEFERKLKEKKAADATATLKSKKGVCGDYAGLLTEMCAVVDIESKVIPGYGKNNRNKIGVLPKGATHAWNSVRINDHWYLMDVTWASGGSTGGDFNYKKKFKEGFFLVDPINFIKNHFPKDKADQYLDPSLTDVEFSEIPFIGFGYYKYKVADYSPKNVFIKPASELTFTLKLDRNVDPKKIGVFVGKIKIPTEVEKIGEEYVIRLKSFKKKSGKLSVVIREGAVQSSELLIYKLRG